MGTRSDLEDRPVRELGNGLARLLEFRRHVDEHRAELAAAAADTLVAELVTLAPDRLDRELEDELCTRLGVRLQGWADGPMEDCVGPNLFAAAIIAAAAAAVHQALQDKSGQPGGWSAAWRVLTAMAESVAAPERVTAAKTMDDLRTAAGGHVLPTTTSRPQVSGRVLWTRDAYGSRFGITAAFATPDGPDRWYLWDIDACGYQAFTVHSAYYPTPEQALAAWQAVVGDVAAARTAFTPVDDPWLLADLMPADEGFLRAGGENTDQFAEYHRCRRAGGIGDQRGQGRLFRTPTADRPRRRVGCHRIHHLAADAPSRPATTCRLGRANHGTGGLLAYR